MCSIPRPAGTKQGKHSVPLRPRRWAFECPIPGRLDSPSGWPQYPRPGKPKLRRPRRYRERAGTSNGQAASILAAPLGRWGTLTKPDCMVEPDFRDKRREDKLVGSISSRRRTRPENRSDRLGNKTGSSNRGTVKVVRTPRRYGRTKSWTRPGGAAAAQDFRDHRLPHATTSPVTLGGSRNTVGSHRSRTSR